MTNDSIYGTTEDVHHEMFTVQEVATRLRISPNTVYELIAQGKLECYRIGTRRGTIRISQEQLQDFLEDSRATVTERKPVRRRKRKNLKHLRL